MLDANGKSLPGPLIIGTFEKRAPERLRGMRAKESAISGDKVQTHYMT